MLPENLPAIELFLGCLTQWRVGFSGPTGLDYHGVEAAGRLLGVAIDPPLFRGIQTIEAAWLEAIGDLAKRRQPNAVER